MSFWISCFSFAACLFVANFIVRLTAFAFIRQRESRFVTVDGLRGFLALSVFFHHFVITYYWKVGGEWRNPPEIYYENYGKVGVSIFFMITGFLFVSKLLNSGGSVNWLKLYESRVFRIYPLYLFAILCISLVAFSYSGFEQNSTYTDLFKEYARWLLFIGGSINEFPETRLVIAAVDWTLKYEWIFYLTLPILSLVIFKGGVLLSFLLVFFCFVGFIFPVDLGVLSTKYFVLFVVGGLSAWVLGRKKSESVFIKSKAASFFACLLFIISLLYPNSLDFWHLIIMSSFFVTILFGCDLFGLLRTKAAILLGEVSYSIYLLHGVILYVFMTHLPVMDVGVKPAEEASIYMPLLSIVVIVVSCLTYLLIEKPFLQFGRQYKITMLIDLAASKIKK